MKKSFARKLAFKHIAQVNQYLDTRILVEFYLMGQGIEPPKAANDESFNARVTCPDWWARRLIKKDLRDKEAAVIHAGYVAKGQQIYASDYVVKYQSERWNATLDCMQNQMMVSEDGDEIDMLRILEASIANPENRYAELMVRMAGFESHADTMGHQGVFYTITCPSKYHRFSRGGLNDDYGYTPRQAQDYLCKVWAQIRSKLKRDHIEVYGFRVAEPHHDACPHWHMLLFMPPHQVESCTNIMLKYAIAEDGHELEFNRADGSPGHTVRFDAKPIVKEILTKDGIKKCSATGYLAKYIAKNIGRDLGFNLGVDGEDEQRTSNELCERVLSWSQTWGIRQFQQIGGSSVTVWRELRRLKNADIEHDIIRQARDLCVANDWAGFLKIMGGTDIARVDAEIKLLKKNIIDTETGEIALNKYHEIVEKIVGICAQASEVITHVKKWVMVSKGQNVSTKTAKDREASAASLAAFAFLGAL